MHVVQIFPGEVPPPTYGGIERMVFWICKELLKRGNKVTLLSSGRSTISDVVPGINWVPIDSLREDYLSKIPKDADVVHFHAIPPVDNIPKTPFVITEHGNIRKKVSLPPNLIFLSRSHAYNHNSEHYVYNGIPLEEYPLELKKDKKFLFMAKLGWRKKNAKTAIDLSLDTGTPLELTGGDLWNTKKIKGGWLLRARNKRDLLRNNGMVGGDEKLNLLRESRVLFYLVNWQEPFALAPHEALACGTPVLASPNGALAEYIKHGVNGYLVESYRQALNALEECMSLDCAAMAKMAKACRDSAFTIEQCVDGYMEKYLQVIDMGELPGSLSKRVKFKPKRSLIIKRPLFFK